MLATLAALATRRSRPVLVVWVVVVAILALLGRGIDDRIDVAGLQLAGTDAAVEQELRDEHFGQTSTVPVLVHGPAAAVSEEAPRIARRLQADPANRVLVPPARAAGPGRRAVLVLVIRRLEPGQQPVDAAEPVDAVARSTDPAVTARVTGPVAVASSISRQGIDAAAHAELIAFPVLLIVLLLLFRSPLAALVPAIVGGSTVAAAMGGIDLLLRAGLELDAFAVNLASIMGLALGVDYSLLIVTRFRQAWSERDPSASTAAEVGRAATLTTLTAGRTAAHAGALLMVAMLTAVLFAPGTSVLSAAVGVLLTAVIATGSSLLAVPAALTLVGAHLDRWRIGGPPTARQGRLATLVLRRPRRAILLTLLPLLAVSAPAVGLEANAPTSRQLPADDPVRADVEVLRSSYGVGWEAPLEVTYATDETPTTSPRILEALVASQRRVLAMPGVTAAVGPQEIATEIAAVVGDAGIDRLETGSRPTGAAPAPAPAPAPASAPPDEPAASRRSSTPPGAGRGPAAIIGADGRGHLVLAAIAGGPPAARSAARVLVDPAFGGRGMRMFVAPDGGAGSQQAVAVHRRLQEELARVAGDHGLRAAVGGVGGEVVEYEDVLTHRFPVLVLALTIASFVALAVLLRCLLVPLVAVLLNLVTVAATFGALVLGFVGTDPILGGPGDIDTLALTMIFVIVFALSIDYQVFLLSRMREALVGARGSHEAIRSALISTGPVVTGAALIMCAVFAAFATTDSVFLRQLGIGLVFAIAVDATVVRMVLLPAILVLLGDRAWTPLRHDRPAPPDGAAPPVATVQGQP